MGLWEWERCELEQRRNGNVNGAVGTGMETAPTVIGEQAIGDALLPARNVQWRIILSISIGNRLSLSKHVRT
jgi:hypothetical protein